MKKGDKLSNQKHFVAVTAEFINGKRQTPIIPHASAAAASSCVNCTDPKTLLL